MTIFTDVRVKTLKPKEGQAQTDYSDGHKFQSKGKLVIRVTAHSKTWGISYRCHGRRRRMTYDTYPKLSIKDARIRAESDLADAAGGNDPSDANRAYKGDPRLEDFWPIYLKNLTVAPSTRKQYEGYWRREIKPTIGSYKLTDLTRRHVIAVTDGLINRGHGSAANRCHNMLSGIFRSALNKSFISVHPMYGMDLPFNGEVSRERFLSDKEIAKFWQVTEGGHANADALRMTLLSAKRPSEVRSMRWDTIEDGDWTSYNSKTKKPVKAIHIVPISPPMQRLLDGRKTTSEYVFGSSQSTSGHVEDYSGHYRKLNEAMGCSANPWRPHDLRRTAETIMAKLGIAKHVREAVLAHTPDKVSLSYNRYDYHQEKLDALTKVGQYINRCIAKHSKSNVVQLIAV